jgi:hypothetical protein
MARRACTSTSADVRRLTLIAVAVVLAAASACGGGGSSGTTSTSSSKQSTGSSKKTSTSSKKSSSKTSGKSSTTKPTKPPTTTSTSNPLAVEGNNGPGCRFIVAGIAKRFEKPEPNAIVQYLNNAVATPTACYDEVSFTFDKGDADGLQAPGYTVEYRKKPFGLLGADGKPLNTSTGGFRPAKVVLYVEMTPAATKDLRNPGRPLDTYKGNLRLLLPKRIVHVNIVEWIQKLPPDATPTNFNDDKVVWLIGLDKKRPFTVDYATQPAPHINVLIMH